MGFPGFSIGKESTCNAGDAGSIAESGRSPGGGHGNPLHYSCLEDPTRVMDLRHDFFSLLSLILTCIYLTDLKKTLTLETFSA